MESTVSKTARDWQAAIVEGSSTSERLVQDCLSIIDQSEPSVNAWVSLNREYALEQAVDRDEQRKSGRAVGALQGIPFGIKDSIDTKDLPTQRGSSIYANRHADADAAIVEKLKEAGAVVMGKTVTTELAWMHPGKTLNPHNLEYSPGGSSSGSAAAVAAGHVPLAIGSQTGGSVIRPASYCGVYGFKPSSGILSRRGVLQSSQTLDQLGLFARDLGDIALACDALKGFDANDSESYVGPKPALVEGYLEDAPLPPNLAWIDMPYASRFSQNTHDGFSELNEVITELSPGCVERIEAPQSFAALVGCHQVIQDFEMARSLSGEWEHHRQQLSETTQSKLLDAFKVTEDEYQEAMGIRVAAMDWFKTFFHDYDAILTPSAIDIAPPVSDAHTGDPICCVVWTLCGLPCLSLPLLSGEKDLPVGVQLVGSYQYDHRLLRTARWLIELLHQNENS